MSTTVHTADSIANFLIHLASQRVVGDSEEREGITNLKLQKVLYFVQACSLAQTGKPLFTDPIEAWEYGPVVPTIYKKYKEHGSNPITLEKYTDSLPDKTKESVSDVWKTFGGYSAGKLVDITHAHSPWKEAYQAPNKTISKKSLKEYYTSLLT